jgi:hypothetical protein
MVAFEIAALPAAARSATTLPDLYLHLMTSSMSVLRTSLSLIFMALAEYSSTFASRSFTVVKVLTRSSGLSF